ncbi:MAG: class I SAM-dependent methyltransferase [Candidatus Parcubacteria bacterium]|nr:class I SAM-dependent methyltransferase [Candidatus Parcubacteria bacterium]
MQPASIIVDIGCGTGLLASELAKRGHKVIGVEPEKTMLEVARNRPNGELVHWIEGDATKVGQTNADLAIMTGHVAQVFLDDKKWRETLKAIYKSLRACGTIAFESRNPVVKPWASWVPETSRREKVDPVFGKVVVWSQLRELKDNRARYEMHYHFEKTGEDLVSVNEIIFRSQNEITKSLIDVGFSVQSIYGSWDRGLVNEKSSELIFVAVRN